MIILGGFDLSVGAVVALGERGDRHHVRLHLLLFRRQCRHHRERRRCRAWLRKLAVGLVNGFCVAKLKVSGFLVTLGPMSATAGVGLMITRGIPVYGMPEIFVKGFGRAQIFGLPTAVYVALAVVLVMMSFAQRRTLFGRYVYAIGGNVDAAVVSGVSIQRHIVGTYVVSSVLAALTGILLTAQVGSGQASFGGDRMMLQSIAAAVIGGVSLRGGIGRVEIVTISALFLTILGNVLNLLHIDLAACSRYFSVSHHGGGRGAGRTQPTEEVPCLTSNCRSTQRTRGLHEAAADQRWLWRAVLPIALVVLLFGFAAVDRGVLSSANLLNIAQQTSYLALFAMAQTVVILTRGFDLALGPTVSMVSVGTALAMAGATAAGHDTTTVLLAGLGAGFGLGIARGLFNGIVIAILGVSPFVATLGSYNIAIGVATTLSSGRPVQGVPTCSRRSSTAAAFPRRAGRHT